MDFNPIFKKYGSIYGIDWKMLKAIAMIESSEGKNSRVLAGINNPTDLISSQSTDGKSWGLMQVRPTTAQDFDPQATAEKLNNPDYSVKIAAQYLAYLETLFPRTDTRYREWVIKSYNQGQGNTAKERRGEIAGYAYEYWMKYKRAYSSINGL